MRSETKRIENELDANDEYLEGGRIDAREHTDTRTALLAELDAIFAPMPW